jgi:putative transposase
MRPQTHLSVESMCRLAQVSRAGFYRRWQQREPHSEETELRAEVQRIALTHRRNYGYRRVTEQLRSEGWAVNRKRIARLMTEDNLLCLRRRRFAVTTDSGHQLRVHLNLAARLELTGIDQLWVADITYIRLAEQFVYLAVVLDAYSRRVVGWALDERLDATLAVCALRQAIDARQPAAGLVHHSDRGVQYASAAYASLLEQHGIAPSMSRPGNPYDNAQCESFIKTLKQEEIYTRRYRDRADLEAHIEQFIERYYNRRRLHSALDYRTPEDFERSLPKLPAPAPAVNMSFFRHEGIVPMIRHRCGRNRDPSRIYRCDEFQPGNPRRVALQQGPPPLPRPTSSCNTNSRSSR